MLLSKEQIVEGEINLVSLTRHNQSVCAAK